MSFAPVGICGGGLTQCFSVCTTGIRTGDIVTGTDTQGFYYSADTGTNWHPRNAGVGAASSTKQIPGIMWSSQELVSGSGGTALYAIYALTGDAKLNGVASGGGLMVSLDGALTWQLRSPAVQGAGNHGAVPVPEGGFPRPVGRLLAEDSSFLYAATYGQGVKRSADHGATWSAAFTMAGAAPGTGNYFSYAMFLDTATGNLYLGTYPQSVTPANGGLWVCTAPQAANPNFTRITLPAGTNAPAPFSGPEVEDIVIFDGTIYLACGNQGIWNSTNGGTTWANVSGTIDVSAGNSVWTSIDGYLSGTNHVVAATCSNPLPFASGGTDQCAVKLTVASHGTGAVTTANLADKTNVTWTPVPGYGAWPFNSDGGLALGKQGFRNPSQVRFDPNDGTRQRIFITGAFGFYLSADGGATWTTKNHGYAGFLGHAATADPNHAGVMVFGDSDWSGWKLTDGVGAAGNLARNDSGAQSFAFAFDPLDSTIYTGIGHKFAIPNSNGGVKSQPYTGTTWTDMGAPFSKCCLGLCAFRDAAGTGSGILFGTNNATWSDMVTGGVTGMTSALEYNKGAGNTGIDAGGIPNSWPGPGNSFAAGVRIQIVHFQPEFASTLAGTNDAALTSFFQGAPAGSWLMPYHEANLKQNNFNPADIVAQDRYLIALKNRVKPSLQYVRGFATYGPAHQGQDLTPWIAPGMDGYGMDGYQASSPTRTPASEFGATLSAIRAVAGAGVKVSILETGTALTAPTPAGVPAVTAWFDSVTTYAINQNLTLVQSYWLTPGTPVSGLNASQNWDNSFAPEMNSVITALGKAGGGGGGTGGKVLVAAVLGDGIYRWTAAGGWTGPVPAPGPPGTPAACVTLTANGVTTGTGYPMIYGGGGVVYMWDRLAGIWRSRDYGKTWAQIWNKTSTATNACDMALNPNVTGELWVSAADGLYKLTGADTGTVTSGGVTVSTITAPAVASNGGVAFDKAGNVYCVTWGGEGYINDLLRSTDHGVTWHSVAGDASFAQSSCTPRKLEISQLDGRIYLDTCNAICTGLPGSTPPPPPGVSGAFTEVQNGGSTGGVTGTLDLWFSGTSQVASTAGTLLTARIETTDGLQAVTPPAGWQLVADGHAAAATGTSRAMIYAYPANPGGLYGNAVPAPSTLAVTANAGGGTFAAGTYFWKVTGVSADGETTGSNEATAAIALNGTASLTWAALPAGTTGVNVYRGTAAGGENVVVASLGAVTSYTDTGTAGTASGPPLVPAAGTATFTYSNSATQVRGRLGEFSAPAGYIQAVDQAGTASASASATSLPVSTSAADNWTNGLGVVIFTTRWSTAGTGQSWTTPAGWGSNTISVISNQVDDYAMYSKTGLAAGVQSVTGTVNPGTGGTMTAWAAAVATFYSYPGPPSVVTTSLPEGQATVAYSAALTASGVAPFTWAASGLPSGLSLNTSTGVISGTPATAGVYSVSVTVTDSVSQTASAVLTFNVVQVLADTTATPLPGGQAAAAYPPVQFTATGGTSPYAWAQAGGTMPPGLALNASGVLAGTPVTAGTYTFTAKVTDSHGLFVTKSMTVTISAAAALAVTTSALPAGTAGVPYTATLAAAGGTLPYSWAVTAGALPAGLTLASGGMISGTPAAAGTASFTVTVTDPASHTAARSLTITVSAAGALVITTPGLAPATQGQPYLAQLAETGGLPPFTWTVTGGVLPPGMTLDPVTGILSGTPTVPGNYTFTITVSD